MQKKIRMKSKVLCTKDGTVEREQKSILCVGKVITIVKTLGNKFRNCRDAQTYWSSDITCKCKSTSLKGGRLL